MNVYGNLNMRQLLVALQFPDWNAWLPRLHPLDGFNKADADVYQDRNGVPTTGNVPYFQDQYLKAASAKNNATLDDMAQNIRLWLREGSTCFTQNKDSGADWRSINSKVLIRLNTWCRGMWQNHQKRHARACGAGLTRGVQPCDAKAKRADSDHQHPGGRHDCGDTAQCQELPLHATGLNIANRYFSTLSAIVLWYNCAKNYLAAL